MAFIPVVCCAPGRRPRGRGPPGSGESGRSALPASAGDVSAEVRASARAALASGRRALLADVLVSSVRRESRTFDAAAYALLVAGLIRALSPALSPEAPDVRVVLPGSRAAVELGGALRDAPEEAGIPPVRVEVLGSAAAGAPPAGAEVVVDPPAGRRRETQALRELVSDARARGAPVLVLNLPQEGAVFDAAGRQGVVPRELVDFTHVFTLAPFALRVAEGPKEGQGIARFLLAHAFPGKWQLWRARAEGEGGEEGEVEVPSTVGELLGLAEARETEATGGSRGDVYVLCEEWEKRPAQDALFDVVRRVMRAQLGL